MAIGQQYEKLRFGELHITGGNPTGTYFEKET